MVVCCGIEGRGLAFFFLFFFLLFFPREYPRLSSHKFLVSGVGYYYSLGSQPQTRSRIIFKTIVMADKTVNYRS